MFQNEGIHPPGWPVPQPLPQRWGSAHFKNISTHLSNYATSQPLLFWICTLLQNVRTHVQYQTIRCY